MNSTLFIIGIHNSVNGNRGGNAKLVSISFAGAFLFSFLYFCSSYAYLSGAGSTFACTFYFFNHISCFCQNNAFRVYLCFRYHEHVVWGDKDLKLKLLRKGILTRIYSPMVRKVMFLLTLYIKCNQQIEIEWILFVKARQINRIHLKVVEITICNHC